MGGQGRVVVGKWRHLYLRNNKKILKESLLGERKNRFTNPLTEGAGLLHPSLDKTGSSVLDLAGQDLTCLHSGF